MHPYRIKDHPPDSLVMRVHPRSLTCRISSHRNVNPSLRDVRQDLCPLQRDSQKLYLRLRRQPWTELRSSKSLGTSLNNLRESEVPSPLIKLDEQRLLKPPLQLVVYPKTLKMLPKVPLLKRIWSPGCQGLGEEEMSMKAPKTRKAAISESPNTFRDLLTKTSCCGGDPALGAASLRTIT